MQTIERQYSTLNYFDARKTPNRCLSIACITAVQEHVLLKAHSFKGFTAEKNNRNNNL